MKATTSPSATTKDQYDKEREFLRDLLVACEKDEVDKVKQMEVDLKNNHKNVSVCDYRDGKKAGAVHAAARGGALKTLQYLLSLRPEQGGLKDAENRTPIMAACASEQGAECIKYLLENNSFAKESVDVVSSGSSCAIHLAASLDSDEAMGYLLELGQANPNAPSDAGLPLHWAVAHANNERTCKKLLGTGKVDVNAQISGVGPTAIIIAALRGKPSIVRYLCEAGADLKVRAQNLMPLHASAAGGNKECVEAILIKGGEELCQLRDAEENLRAIDVAAHAGHEDIVEFLGPRTGLKGLNAQQLIKEAHEEHAKLLKKAEEDRIAADSKAAVVKEEGNQYFLKGSFDEAIVSYEAASNIPNISPLIKATLLSNISACHIKQSRFVEAQESARIARNADPKFMKAYYRLGQAYSAVKDHEGAATAYWDAYQLDKSGPEAANFMKLFQKEIELGKKAYAAQQNAPKPT